MRVFFVDLCDFPIAEHLDRSLKLAGARSRRDLGFAQRAEL
ncbi:MAG: hypothetical protein ACFBSE_08645 [Prochloraceae cyanobacterium]